jgi:hypothetical protein
VSRYTRLLIRAHGGCDKLTEGAYFSLILPPFLSGARGALHSTLYTSFLHLTDC